MDQKILEEAILYVSDYLKVIPETALILGSGLGALAEDLTESVSVEYKNIPGFPVSTAPGHASKLVFGYLQRIPVLMFQGRFHLYEGYSPHEIAFPIRFLKALGCTTLVLTNAAGGINPSFKPGDLMLISDHINFTGSNPLIGGNEDLSGERFPDMSKPYDHNLQKILYKAADTLKINLKSGTYASMTGPSFETPAEIKMLRIIGADAIGMSTVPEVITAVHSGLKVLGISCISNMASGILDQPITAEEVIETGKVVKGVFISLIKEFVSILDKADK